jgi:hypothetical protein
MVLNIRKEQTNSDIFARDVYMKEIKVEDNSLKMCQIKLSGGARETIKIKYIKRMGNRLNKYNLDAHAVTSPIMKDIRHIFPRLRTVNESIKEDQNIADDLFDTLEYVNYMSTFIKYAKM